jgi:glucokinase
VNGDIDKISAVHVASAAKNGDELSRDVIARAAGYLGIGLANIINIFNPEIIVIGGGLSNIGALLLQPAKKIARERGFKLPGKTAKIVRAKLGSNAGIVGAAAYAFDRQ